MAALGLNSEDWSFKKSAPESNALEMEVLGSDGD